MSTWNSKCRQVRTTKGVWNLHLIRTIFIFGLDTPTCSLRSQTRWYIYCFLISIYILMEYIMPGLHIYLYPVCPERGAWPSEYPRHILELVQIKLPGCSAGNRREEPNTWFYAQSPKFLDMHEGCSCFLLLFLIYSDLKKISAQSISLQRPSDFIRRCRPFDGSVLRTGS